MMKESVYRGEIPKLNYAVLAGILVVVGMLGVISLAEAMSFTGPDPEEVYFSPVE